MEIIHFALNHPFDWLGDLAIIASLLFAAVELKHSQTEQRIANVLSVTRQYREIWSALYDRPELARVLDAKADLKSQPVTLEEQLFVTFLIHHLNACFEATEAGVFQAAGRVEQDINRFFSLPIPKSVWEKSKAMQDSRFAAFVENGLSSHDSSSGQEH